jgi:hypothetical protein
MNAFQLRRIAKAILAATRGKRFANWKNLTSDAPASTPGMALGVAGANQNNRFESVYYDQFPQTRPGLARTLRLGKRLYASRNP